MMNEKMGEVLGKLASLAFSLNNLIDTNKHEGVTKDEVYAAIENKTIFQYLKRFEPSINWGIGTLSEDDRFHLTGEWQSMANAYDSQSDFGVHNNGICLLLAYVLAGIQMRTTSKEAWPGPDPW